ncbi:hypothetical protein BV898_09280 [Hypsibius exemplaris]|uniref:G-protein coupled receptors family 1 profile domain-containing protein n=1 Tax=Hypsibius exemplaris TaxID=2072580 RepID=A0A1W0WN19_HYPEX|nr:hypothetical protein BV898_09280 [Hypsibius exemplaris]
MKNETNQSSPGGSTGNVTAQWSALPVCELLALITGLTGNGALLIVFLLNLQTLWTPFNVYVVNLLVANCAVLSTQLPLDVYTNLHDGQWTLGEHACSYYIVVSAYFEPVVFNSHQLIAINRIWAVTHPISYRRIHSVRTALCL